MNPKTLCKAAALRRGRTPAGMEAGQGPLGRVLLLMMRALLMRTKMHGKNPWTRLEMKS